jgi:hypothetical protein
VNRLGKFGRWDFLEITTDNVHEVENLIAGFAKSKELA